MGQGLLIDYVPGLDAIAANRVKIALAVFPGGHTAAVEMPSTFAVALRGLLARLRE